MVKLGFPLLSGCAGSISFLVISAIVNTLGVIPSAGVGVAEKLCGFVLLVPSAYGQAMSAFVAHNIGARRPERANGPCIWYTHFSGSGRVPGVFSFFPEICWLVCSPGTGRWCWRRQIICGLCH
ncbi:MAG: MATE family efflux transporter [Ruminococcus sp.]